MYASESTSSSREFIQAGYGLFGQCALLRQVHGGFAHYTHVTDYTNGTLSSFFPLLSELAEFVSRRALWAVVCASHGFLFPWGGGCCFWLPTAALDIKRPYYGESRHPPALHSRIHPIRRCPPYGGGATMQQMLWQCRATMQVNNSILDKCDWERGHPDGSRGRSD